MAKGEAHIQQTLSDLSHWREWAVNQQRATAEIVIAHFAQAPTDEKIAALASALASSGDIWDWPEEFLPRSDVVSTGGPGSLSTLLCPILLASLGCYVPKVSVPGSVAGAIDTMGCIPGFQTRLRQKQMVEVMRRVGIAHSENTDSLAPADGYIFKIRAATGRKSIPALTMASLLSKKLAVSCPACAVDVRCEPGGNLGSTEAEACENAETYVRVARMVGISVRCVVTNSLHPQSPLFGRTESLNALVSILEGAAGDPWMQSHVETCIEIACQGLLATGAFEDDDAARGAIEHAISSGHAHSVFMEHVEAQGGRIDLLASEIQGSSDGHTEILSQGDGVLCAIDQPLIAAIVKRVNRADPNHCGVRLLVPPGERVARGQPLAVLRLRGSPGAAESSILGAHLQEAFEISYRPVEPAGPLILRVVHDTV